MRVFSYLDDLPEKFQRLPCGDYFIFPDVEQSVGSVVAVGGVLSPGVMLSAYVQGLFPWFDGDKPIFWHSPDPRFVLFPKDFHVPSRLQREMKKAPFSLTADTAFKRVILSCAETPRPNGEESWITKEIVRASLELHNAGFMHSVEVWDEARRLVGGFFGVQLGSVFSGQSMFSLKPGASKIAFALFARKFFEEMGGTLIDSQTYTDHIARFGAKNISRQAYLRLLRDTFSGLDFSFRCWNIPDSLFRIKQDWSYFFPPASLPVRELAQTGRSV